MRILSADLVNAHALADFVHEHQSCVRIKLNFKSACKLRIYSMRDQQTRIVRMRVIFFLFPFENTYMIIHTASRSLELFWI